MIRDPERIDEVLEAVEEYWKEHPDLRLAQIVSNMAMRCGRGIEPFYMEDRELLNELERRKEE